MEVGGIGQREILEAVRSGCSWPAVVPVKAGPEEIGEALVWERWSVAGDDLLRYGGACAGYRVDLALVDVRCFLTGQAEKVVIERFVVIGSEDLWGEPVVLAERLRDVHGEEPGLDRTHNVLVVCPSCGCRGRACVDPLAGLPFLAEQAITCPKCGQSAGAAESMAWGER